MAASLSSLQRHDRPKRVGKAQGILSQPLLHRTAFRVLYRYLKQEEMGNTVQCSDTLNVMMRQDLLDDGPGESSLLFGNVCSTAQDRLFQWWRQGSTALIGASIGADKGPGDTSGADCAVAWAAW